MHRARTALVAALALTATFAVATPASADGENLALAATATAISSAAGYTPAGANDGVIPVITTPADEWASNEQQNGVWLRLTWSSPQTLSQVKLYDRSFTFTSNILGGTLSFSDGSTVSVGALPEDGQTPATVNFAARSVTWVQFTVTAVTPGSWAAVGLAEFEAYGEGGPPPTGDCPAGIYPMHKVSVLDPAYGATVSGANVTIRICAPGMGNVWARSWHQPDAAHPDAKGYDRRFQNVAPDATGYATLTFPASEYPRGPIAVLIDAWDGVEGSGTFTVTDTAYLQLHNTGGTSWNEGAPAGVPAAAGGKSLAFVDDFDGSLSISRTGAGATYASAKPDGPNGTEFGDGIFADFTGPYNPFATLSNEYLRIRASKTPPGYVDPMGWGRQYFTGNLSSARTDGTGIAYQYGYFEARILMPSAPGTWSSLWLMSLNSLPTGAGGLPTTAEIDVVEQFGHAPSWSCQAQHSWATTPELHTNSCLQNLPFGDAANTWHRWGVNVTPTDTIYYIDDVEVWRQPTIAQAKTPMYFFLTLALGGGWPVDLSRYNNQVDMYVDYVRIYT